MLVRDTPSRSPLGNASEQIDVDGPTFSHKRELWALSPCSFYQPREILHFTATLLQVLFLQKLSEAAMLSLARSLSPTFTRLCLSCDVQADDEFYIDDLGAKLRAACGLAKLKVSVTNLDIACLLSGMGCLVLELYNLLYNNLFIIYNHILTCKNIVFCIV